MFRQLLGETQWLSEVEMTTITTQEVRRIRILFFCGIDFISLQAEEIDHLFCLIKNITVRKSNPESTVVYSSALAMFIVVKSS